jgi:hypothetical protein
MTVPRGTLHALCVLYGIFGVATPGSALPSPAAAVALVWRAPAGCPSQSEVLSALAAAVDANLEPDSIPALEVNVVVEQAGVHWRAHLHMSGALEAARTLEGDSCTALAEASVWLVVQTLRSLAASAADEAAASTPKAEHEQAQRVAPEPALASPDVAQRATDADQPLGAAGARSLELVLAVWLDSGALPGVSVALGLEVGLNLDAWRFALRPRVFIPRSTAVTGSELASASASFWLGELPVQACYGLTLGELKIGPCASMIVGVMGGSSEGVRDARARTGPWLAMEGAVAAVWPITARMAVRGELALARPLRAPSFLVDSEVHRTDGVLVRAGLAVGARF